jgi:hypothetical protein
MSDFNTSKVDGNTVGSAEWNQLSDVDNLTTTSGQTPSTTDLFQLSIASARYSSGGQFFTDSGTANTYVLSPVSPFKSPVDATNTYFNGMTIRFRAGNANSGASTVNVNGAGSKNLKKEDGSTDLTAGDILTTKDSRFRYDGTSFVLVQDIRPASTTNQGVTYLTPNKNVIINGNFSINQRVVSGTVVLTAGSYGHDRWKAGASGCTYTFATSNNITTLTISAGSLIQVIEGNNLVSDTYCLSWSGTAQGKIGAGSYGASGITGSATGGTNLNIEFGTGTLSLVQLEKNLAPTPFEHRFFADELRLCQRYYEKTYNQSAVAGALTFIGSRAFSSQNGQQNLCPVYFKVTKRANPTITLFSPITGVAGKISTGVIDIDGTAYNPAEDGFYVGPTTTTTLTNLFFQYSAISEL